MSYSKPSLEPSQRSKTPLPLKLEETKILELFIPKQSAWCLANKGLKLAVNG